MLRFSEVRLSDVWDEALPLMREHFLETGDSEDFDPNKEIYFAVDDGGMSKTFIARNEYDEIVGYCHFFILPHQHSKEKIRAAQDALYLKKQYRGFGGIRFISWVDAELKEEGVQHIYRPVSIHNDYSRTLTSMGYEHVESGYLRRI